MWVDVFIVSILLYAVVQGFRRGFVQTFLHAVGWILAVVLGFAWYPHVIGFLKGNTDYYDSVREKIAERIAEKAGGTADSAMTGIPEVIRDLLDNAVNAMTGAIADTLSVSLTNLIFNIIGFLAVVIAIKIILMLITLLFSKEKRGGIIGVLDGYLGFFAGALRGMLVIYILLALMVPVTSLSDSSFITGQIDASVFGSYLYENNLILRLVKGLL